MKLWSSSSRQERQIRNLERGLLVGGTLMLCLTMGMTWRFGWGLGHDDWGRFSSAMFYSGADFIGALFMGLVGLLFGWRWYAAGTLALAFTAACIIFSLVTIFGFQSSNRTAVTLNYEAKQKQADKRLEWLRGLTVDKALTKDRGALLTEERDQYKSMQETQADPDAQASEVAAMFGTTKDQAQRGLNIWAAGFILFLQFGCLAFRSFLRHRVAPAINALTNGPLTVKNVGTLTDTVSDTVRKISKAEAKSDMQQLISAGMELSNEECAVRWGVSDSKASNWRTEFQRAGICRIAQRGRRKLAVAPRQPLNGKLHVVS